MKIASFYVLIPLSLNFIFLTCTNMNTEKTIENELQNLCHGIPVHKGIQEIIIDSKHQFRYAKTFSLLVSNENWFTEIEPIEYFPSKTVKKFLSNQPKKNPKKIESLFPNVSPIGLLLLLYN